MKAATHAAPAAPTRDEDRDAAPPAAPTGDGDREATAPAA